MKNVLKFISIVIIFVCFSIFIYINFSEYHSIVSHDKIISGFFNDSEIYFNDHYMGYIYIPSLKISRLIKYGTSSDILDSGFVGLYASVDDLSSNNLIILAGHNISSVFGKLHDIMIGDSVFIRSSSTYRKFVVYGMDIISEDNISILSQSRRNELLLITCDEPGYRFIVFLREDL